MAFFVGMAVMIIAPTIILVMAALFGLISQVFGGGGA